MLVMPLVIALLMGITPFVPGRLLGLISWELALPADGLLMEPCVDLRSQGSGPSSIGAAAFHDPVRDGTGWVHRANHTQSGSGEWIRTTDLRVMSPTSCHCSTPRRYLFIPAAWLEPPAPTTARPFAGKPSALRTHHLHVSPRVQCEPLIPVVFREPYLAIPVRLLIFRRISHLDAFSGSCFRT